jgi:hypothetical protein
MFVTANSVIDDGAIATLGDDGQFKGFGSSRPDDGSGPL